VLERGLLLLLFVTLSEFFLSLPLPNTLFLSEPFRFRFVWACCTSAMAPAPRPRCEGGRSRPPLSRSAPSGFSWSLLVRRKLSRERILPETDRLWLGGPPSPRLLGLLLSLCSFSWPVMTSSSILGNGVGASDSGAPYVDRIMARLGGIGGAACCVRRRFLRGAAVSRHETARVAVWSMPQ
jgi:hypothetical protein